MAILLVDDSAVSRAFLTRVLNDAGYKDIVAAKTGAEAYAILGIGTDQGHPSRIDLVLLDLLLPDTNGVEICARIKGDERYADVPVIMITSLESMDVLKVAFEIGAFDYIKKPADSVELAARVRSALKLKDEIDSRKAREREAFDNENLLRAVLDNAVDGTIIINEDRIVESFNKASERIFGYAAAEVIGRNVNMLMPDPYRSEHDGYVRNYIRTGVKKIIGIGREVVGLKKNGETFPMELSVSEARVRNKRLFTGLIRDISEKKTSIKELRETHTLQKAILESARYSIISTTPEGIITVFNKAAEMMLGYKADELVGRSTPEAFHDRDEVILRAGELAIELGEPIAPGFESFVAKARRGSSEEREWTYIKKDGTRLQVSLSITALRDLDGTITGFLGIAHDISEKKLHEEEIISAKIEAEAANKAKSEFLANMSHEIRTPMNAIIGMADLLSETDLSAEQLEYVGIFQRAGENLLRLINDILDISKVEAGRFEMDVSDFDLADLIERSFDLLAMTARDKGLEALYHLHPDVPIYLRGDPSRLRQVIFNLVGNAIKFTPSGDVVLDIRPKELDEANRICTIEFSVKDTGIGIPEEKIGAIFESFTQTDPSITRKFGGTGLGLTIAKKLVELMGGQIKVESVYGKGSTFSFTVMFGISEKKAEEKLRKINLAGMKVFVIDDNPTNRLILKEQLERMGASVSMAASGMEGIKGLRQAATSGAPDKILFLDRRMPEMDGFATAEAIRLDPSIAGIKIIMMTSDARTDDLNRIKTTGIMDHYFVKPVRRADITMSIARVLGRPDAAQTAEAAKEAQADVRGLRILVAEDAEDNRLLIKAYLKKTPHIAEYADDGRQAVEKYKSAAYDIVLMDIQMPVMDGYTATKKIREWEAHHGKGPVPVIALTAYALADDEQKSIEAGCTAHLSKPVKKQVLLEALSRYGGKENG